MTGEGTDSGGNGQGARGGATGPQAPDPPGQWEPCSCQWNSSGLLGEGAAATARSLLLLLLLNDDEVCTDG